MNDFLIGLGVRDITPASSLALWGYSDRQGPANGVLDPLMVYAVVFRGKETTAALVSADLGRPPMKDVLDAIRERAASLGVAHVFFAATHTHHAPEMDVPNAPHANAVLEGTIEAIAEAVEKLEPARIGTGTATFDIGHNRRRMLDDGRCAMLWRNEERLPTEPVDREATLIKLDRMDGRPVALLVHFACHPVVMGPSNRQYSADYIGEMRRLVEAESGYPCMFLQGACGDINPYLDKTPIDAGGADAARQVGAACARSVLASLPSIGPHSTACGDVAFCQKEVMVGVRWDLNDPDQRRIVFEAHGGERGFFGRYFESATPDLRVPVTVLSLGDAVAFVGLPGEVFVEYQLELKAKAPVRHALLCGYTNEYHAYFPTVAGALAGGYGGAAASYVGIGAADKLLFEAQMILAEMRRPGTAPCKEEEFAIIDWNPAARGARG
ncbi:MAG TPA: neutral/alkaline non-lysosomal ceramidase N-terminal domain-containing protein [Candidatus Hydrogenedentes bacterium]|nr:neutral/alkaline non-lysosomal ceramidase N-terminal domain-containing protein [Candidatus Hydrogenedentota bacterium]